MKLACGNTTKRADLEHQRPRSMKLVCGNTTIEIDIEQEGPRSMKLACGNTTNRADLEHHGPRSMKTKEYICYMAKHKMKFNFLSQPRRFIFLLF